MSCLLTLLVAFACIWSIDASITWQTVIESSAAFEPNRFWISGYQRPMPEELFSKVISYHWKPIAYCVIITHLKNRPHIIVQLMTKFSKWGLLSSGKVSFHIFLIVVNLKLLVNLLVFQLTIWLAIKTYADLDMSSIFSPFALSSVFSLCTLNSCKCLPEFVTAIQSTAAKASSVLCKDIRILGLSGSDHNINVPTTPGSK